ncbi:MAG TPA: hypothetical protein VIT24_10335, partial [Acidimicrobiales bacterium]
TLALAVIGTFHEIPEILITRPPVERGSDTGPASPGELVAAVRRAQLSVRPESGGWVAAGRLGIR